MNHIKMPSKRTLLAIVSILALYVYALIMGAFREKKAPTVSVAIQMDDEFQIVETEVVSVAELLRQQGIELKGSSFINTPLDQSVEEDLFIAINNPYQYRVKVGNMVYPIESYKTDVAEILAEQDLKLDQDDYTVPSMESRLRPGEVVNIYRVFQSSVVETGEVPFSEEIKQDNTLEIGRSKIVQTGKNGIIEREYSALYVNGQLQSREMVREEITAKPVSQILAKGTKPKLVATRSKPVLKTTPGGTISEDIGTTFGPGVLPDGSTYSKAFVMKATAYDPTPASNGIWGNKTALGTLVRFGVVAVDPKIIPLRTRLYIEVDGRPHYGYAVAEDTGSAIKNYRIDLCYETSAEVYHFGVRKVKVYVLD